MCHRRSSARNRALKDRKWRSVRRRNYRSEPNYPGLASRADESSFLTDRTPGTARASSTARELAAGLRTCPRSVTTPASTRASMTAFWSCGSCLNCSSSSRAIAWSLASTSARRSRGTTSSSLRTCLTPSMRRTISAAAFLVSSESTLPRNVTTPRSVSTLICFPQKRRSLQRAVSIFTVSLESATLLFAIGACAEPRATPRTRVSSTMAATSTASQMRMARASDDEISASTRARANLSRLVFPSRHGTREMWAGRSFIDRIEFAWQRSGRGSMHRARCELNSPLLRLGRGWSLGGRRRHDLEASGDILAIAHLVGRFDLGPFLNLRQNRLPAFDLDLGIAGHLESSWEETEET